MDIKSMSTKDIVTELLSRKNSKQLFTVMKDSSVNLSAMDQTIEGPVMILQVEIGDLIPWEHALIEFMDSTDDEVGTTVKFINQEVFSWKYFNLIKGGMEVVSITPLTKEEASEWEQS